MVRRGQSRLRRLVCGVSMLVLGAGLAGQAAAQAADEVEEVVVTGPDQAVATWSPPEAELRPLLVPLVAGGAVDTRWTGASGVQIAAERHRRSRAELPRGARRLSHGDPAVPTVHLALD